MFCTSVQKKEEREAQREQRNREKRNRGSEALQLTSHHFTSSLFTRTAGGRVGEQRLTDREGGGGSGSDQRRLQTGE